MRRNVIAAFAAAWALAATSAVADSPVQLSLWSPVQIVGVDQSVKGLRLALIYGENADVCRPIQPSPGKKR
jgi:hypothetical protein